MANAPRASAPVHPPHRTPDGLSHPVDALDELAFARGVVREQSDALAHLASILGADFTLAVDLVVACADAGGTLIVSGLGKSGLVGAKISATLASLGIPSHAVHPSEAAHGDLGRFRHTDTAVCISCSGETDEVVALAAALKQDGLPIIAIVGGDKSSEPGHKVSSLERLATVTLHLGVKVEAGAPYFVAPTSSTTATLAVGDALALAAAKRRNFTDEDFARRHPGGSLGELLRPVTELLRYTVPKNLPLVPQGVSVGEALQQAQGSGRRPGAIMLVDEQGHLSGIFTDGDLRRLILRDPTELSRPVREVMTKAPRTLPDTALVRDAVNMIREFRQDEIPVVDRANHPVGLLDVQDLIAMKLVRD
ncbi:MAG: KpsF/GutQ family sugar-phosphate isomerase [Phycisphaerales bacterium]|jgi:arabinose-5-phosphate isomerase